jgi:hypothetical protein
MKNVLSYCQELHWHAVKFVSSKNMHIFSLHLPIALYLEYLVPDLFQINDISGVYIS